MTISASSGLCAVIGDPVRHSLSPQIHNAAFQARGLDLVYVALPVKKGDARRALDGVRALGIRGLSVTIPHKVDVVPWLDEVDEVGANIGSINTVVNRAGRLLGYSTDGPGALRALEANRVDPRGRDLLILGTGGAARAIAFTLATLDPPPRLEILGVVPAEMDQLGADLRAKTSISVTTRLLADAILPDALARAEVIVQATPVGMTPQVDASLIPAHLIRPDHVVFDVVYTPLQTKLLKEARAAGARTVPGLGMFVHQAAIQFELWTGQPAPLSVMTATVRQALEGAA
ncbi:MAG: shikimate dehydrogenase [Planctomycetes bacterium RBG_16_64_10]|nr:MAG: shikimate dehydrogenase [Planctomycetes bacterium RBG_16_64_10]